MKLSTLLLVLLSSAHCCFSQVKTDSWLDSLLRAQASPFLLDVLNKPDSFQYQLIYTRIDRDKKNQPQFHHYYLNVDRNRYFNPASMVKMPLAFTALEKLNELHQPALPNTLRC